MPGWESARYNSPPVKGESRHYYWLNELGQLAAALDWLHSKVIECLFQLHLGAAMGSCGRFDAGVSACGRNRLEAFWAEGGLPSFPLDAVCEYYFVFHDVHGPRIGQTGFQGNAQRWDTGYNLCP